MEATLLWKKINKKEDKFFLSQKSFEVLISGAKI